MALITHTIRESLLGKIRQSICKKLLMQMPPVAAIFYTASTPDGSGAYPIIAYEHPLPISNPPNGPGQVYSPMMSGIIANYKSISASMFTNIHNSTWTPSIGFPLGLWDGSALVNARPIAQYTGQGSPGAAYWNLTPTNFCGNIYYVNNPPPPYSFTAGSSMPGAENALYGSYANFCGCAVNVGSLRFTITLYNISPGAGIGAPYRLQSPIATIVPPTAGTTPLTWNGWTIADGSGWVLVPLPDYNDSIVTVLSGWLNGQSSGLDCQFIGDLNGTNGQAAVLTVLPVV